MPRPAAPACCSESASACARASGEFGTLWKPLSSRSQPMVAMTSPMASPPFTQLLRKAEDIEHSTFARRTGQVLHRVDEATRGGAVARVEVVRYDETRPSAHARKHRDVLTTV